METPDLEETLTAQLRKTRGNAFYELISQNDFNLFMNLVPFKATDSFYYVSLNAPYPKPIWWQQPAAGHPRVRVNSLHLCPETGNEYMINAAGKKMVDTKVICISNRLKK